MIFRSKIHSNTRVFNSMFFGLLTILGFPTVLFAQDLATPESWSCNQCFLTERQKCVPACSKIETKHKQEKCLEDCITSGCERSCNLVVDGKKTKEQQQKPAYDKAAISCDYCIDRMTTTSCLRDCADAFDVATCKARCANARCAHKCTLPDKPTAARPQPAKPHRCQVCKRDQQMFCSQSCGDREEAGFTACEVACVEKKCGLECDLENE